MNPLLVQQMSMYAAYHRDPRNRATHFVGVPAIAFSILIPMAWLRLDVGGIQVSLALAFTAAVLVYYVYLNRALAFATTAVYLPILALAEWVSGFPATVGWTVFGLFFVGGWILQLIGHGFEGRKPALMDNLLQIFIAPLFLMAEIMIAVGMMRGLAAAVREGRERYLPDGDGKPATS